MKSRLAHLLLVVSLLVVPFFGGPTAQTQAQALRPAAPIHLRAGTFTPVLGEALEVAPGLRVAEYAAGQRGTYLVQFSGPVEQAWKDALTAQGVEVLDYIPENTFKVRMNPAQARLAAGLANVAWVGVFQPAYKLSPALRREGNQLLRVSLERGVDAAQAAAAVAGTGAQVIGAADGALLVGADAAQVDALARLLEVRWVESYVLPEKHNEYGGGAILGAITVNNNGYDGSSQIAAVADTGLGGGTAATAHPDIPASRVVSIFNWPGVTDACFQTILNDGAVDVDSGHGTHVAGSVLSDGGAAGEGRGVAPAARLVFQATENYVQVSAICQALYGYTNDYYLTGLNNLYGLFQEAYNAGARVHANSWGASVAGDYTANSVTTDDFIWDNRDMTITFSAGNSGADANADGVVDNDSIGAPATAKNVITIGASENDRAGNYQCDTGLTYTSSDTTYQSGQTCASMGGINLLGTPRQRWGFTANPVADDPTAGNAGQMAAFSSRGPTDDGRIKPDVVAPGTWILSTYSGQYQQGYGTVTNPRNGLFQSDGWGIPVSTGYKYFGGTSMANPIAAGGAVVVRDFYQKAHTHNASAALVKATLINSAVDLLDENNDGVNDNDFPIPNVHEGWGRIDLVNATDNTAAWVDNTAGLATGASASYAYTVAGGAPFKVTVVWTDFPSTEAAALNLVNNLNLVVTAPGGAVYRGNVFSGGWSQTGGSADIVNNVENVYVQSAAAGAWTVQVSGASVPQGPQPFALVVEGGTPVVVTPPADPSGLTAATISSSQINLAWTDASANEDGFRIERCAGVSCATFSEIATVGANVTSYSNTGLTASTSYTYRVRAYNAGGNSGYSNTATAVTGAGPVNTGWLSPTANAAVTTSSGDNNGFQTNPANANSDNATFAVDTNSGSGTSTSCTSTAKDRHLYRDYTVTASGAIQGIEVRLDARVDATNGSPRMCVQLSWDGGVTWTATKQTTTLTTSEATYILGGAADTWGRAWTTANLTNANFRVRIINVASNTSRDFSLDWVAVRVTYQP